jgi:hydroxymethylpyrimidine/phosphomethylpyrimidine kinase
MAAHGCYAMTATTALTAQNTLGVEDIHVVPAAFVEKQIEACVGDIGVDVVKTGWCCCCCCTVRVVALDPLFSTHPLMCSNYSASRVCFLDY